jgi:HSP20 family protein
MNLRVYRNRPFWDNIESFMEDFENMMLERPNSTGYEKFPVNIYQEEGKSFLEAELPGFEKKDIKVNIEKNMLTISAEKESNTEKKDEKKKYFIRERNCMKFKRIFQLPENINLENIKANFENGILTLEMENKEKDEKNIEVKIN